jgi:hypothetical protein
MVSGSTMLDIPLVHQQANHSDAIRALAAKLPKPAVVAWACCCIRMVLPALTGEAANALLAAERWVSEPTEINQRAAKALADTVGLEHPAGAAAWAAYLGGPSLAPKDAPMVPPAEGLTARAAAGAILLAIAWQAPELTADLQRRCLALAKTIQ